MTSGVPSSRLASTRPGRSGSGCAITWLEMSTSAGTGSPANGLALRERPQPPRRAPGHRPADRPPAGAQPHRQQRVLLELPDSRLRQPRPGEAHQQPALLHPRDQLRPLRLAERADVGQDQHVRRRVQHLRPAAPRSPRRTAPAPCAGSAAGRSGPAPRRPAARTSARPCAGAPSRRPAPRPPPSARRRAAPAPTRLRSSTGRSSARSSTSSPGRELAGRRPQHPLDAVRVRPQRQRPPPGAAPRVPAAQHADPEGRRPRAAAASAPARSAAARPASPARAPSSACASSASPPWPMPSLQPQRLERLVAAPRSRRPRPPGPAPRRTARAPPAARVHSAAARHGSASPASGAAAIVTTAAGRPLRAASSSAAAARSIRRAQSGASPQPPSSSTRSGVARPLRAAGSAPARRRRGSPPPAPASAAAAATRACAPASSPGRCSPSSSRTPGNARRPGAGGTARSSHQSTGSVAEPEQQPRRQEGDRPDHRRSRPLADRHVEPEQRLRAAAGWCGGSSHRQPRWRAYSMIFARRSASRST